MFLNDIIRLNNELSFYKVIYKHYGIIDLVFWIYLPILLFMVGVVVVFVSIIFGHKWSYFGIFIPTIIYLIISIFKNRKLTKKVIKKKYKYALINKRWTYSSIEQIRIKKVKQKLKLNDKESILNIIGFIERHYTNKKYDFVLTKDFTLILVSSIIGAFIGAYFSMAKNESQLIEYFKFVVPSAIVILIFILVIEIVIKQILIDFRGVKSRLINVLENIYLEL